MLLRQLIDLTEKYSTIELGVETRRNLRKLFSISLITILAGLFDISPMLVRFSGNEDSSLWLVCVHTGAFLGILYLLFRLNHDYKLHTLRIEIWDKIIAERDNLHDEVDNCSGVQEAFIHSFFTAPQFEKIRTQKLAAIQLDLKVGKILGWFGLVINLYVVVAHFIRALFPW